MQNNCCLLGNLSYPLLCFINKTKLDNVIHHFPLGCFNLHYRHHFFKFPSLQSRHAHTSSHWGHTSSWCILIRSMTLSAWLCSAARLVLHKSPPPSQQEGHSVPPLSALTVCLNKITLSSLFLQLYGHVYAQNANRRRRTRKQVCVVQCLSCWQAAK